MGRLKNINGQVPDHDQKMVFISLAVEMLKNSNWAEVGEVTEEIKKTVDQLVDSYNEL